MTILAILLVQLILIPPTIAVMSRQRLGLYTCFYGVYGMLIVIPFYLIFAEVHNLLNLQEIVGKSATATVTLPAGNGVRPLMWMIIFQVCYLIGGYISAKPEAPAVAAPKLDATSMRTLGLLIATFAIVYTVVRFWVVPDFPLFVLLKSGDLTDVRLRDLSFEYATRTDVPYIFLPSINSNVRRILLPVAAFLLMRSAAKTNSRFVTYMAWITFAVALIMHVGQFKRAPLCYFVLWWVLQKHSFSRLKHLVRILAVGVVLVGIMILITSTYQKTDEFSMTKAVLSLFWRLFVGEAICEFLAMEHHGPTYEYHGFDMLTVYFKKVAGMNVMTFSEYWKAEIGGKRGFAAVGAVCEIFISFGPAAAIVLFTGLGVGLANVDQYLMRLNSDDHRPFIAGFIVVFAFAAVKGAMSQFFTGGGLVLLTLYIGTQLFCRSRTSLNAQILRPPNTGSGLSPLARRSRGSL